MRETQLWSPEALGPWCGSLSLDSVHSEQIMTVP